MKCIDVDGSIVEYTNDGWALLRIEGRRPISFNFVGIDQLKAFVVEILKRINGYEDFSDKKTMSDEI